MAHLAWSSCVWTEIGMELYASPFTLGQTMMETAVQANKARNTQLVRGVTPFTLYPWGRRSSLSPGPSDLGPVWCVGLRLETKLYASSPFTLGQALGCTTQHPLSLLLLLPVQFHLPFDGTLDYHTFSIRWSQGS